MTKLNHFPIVAGGMAFGLPIDEAVERLLNCAAALRASAEKAPGASEDFGKKLKEALYCDHSGFGVRRDRQSQRRRVRR